MKCLASKARATGASGKAVIQLFSNVSRPYGKHEQHGPPLNTSMFVQSSEPAVHSAGRRACESSLAYGQVVIARNPAGEYLWWDV